MKIDGFNVADWWIHDIKFEDVYLFPDDMWFAMDNGRIKTDVKNFGGKMSYWVKHWNDEFSVDVWMDRGAIKHLTYEFVFE